MESKTLSTIQKEAKPIIAQIEKIHIESPKDMTEATALLSTVNKKLDAVKKEKEKITKPANEALKAARALFKPVEDQLGGAVLAIRKEMSRYQTESKKAADEEAAKIAARVGKGKGKYTPETAVAKMEEIETPETSVATEEGMVRFRTEKKFEVMDVSKLPTEYILPNEVAIRAAMKTGVEIPGVRYYTEEVPINSR